MENLLIAAVILNTLILIGIIISLIIISTKVTRLTKSLQATWDEISREVTPTLRSAQSTLKSIELLAGTLEKEISRLDNTLIAIDRIASGVAIGQAASSALKTTRVTLSGLLAGIKEGLHLLKERADTSKEE